VYPNLAQPPDTISRPANATATGRHALCLRAGLVARVTVGVVPGKVIGGIRARKCVSQNL